MEVTDANNYDNPDEFVIKGDKKGKGNTLTVKQLLKAMDSVGDADVLAEYDGENVAILSIEEKPTSVILYVY